MSLLGTPIEGNPAAQLLYDKMAAISENKWCCQWRQGLEYDLWDWLMDKELSSDEDNVALHALATQAGGWIWTGAASIYTPRFVSFAEWALITD